MNTEQLQKLHKTTYYNFFINQDSVVSVPFLVNLTWSTITGSYGSHLFHKLPLRLYVWIKYIPKQHLTIDNVISYNSSTNTFTTKQALSYYHQINHIREYLYTIYTDTDKKDNETSKKLWIQLTILTELPLDVGCYHIDCLYGASIVALTHTTNKKILTTHLQQLHHLTHSTYIPGIIDTLLSERATPTASFPYNQENNSTAYHYSFPIETLSSHKNLFYNICTYDIWYTGIAYDTTNNHQQVYQTVYAGADQATHHIQDTINNSLEHYIPVQKPNIITQQSITTIFTTINHCVKNAIALMITLMEQTKHDTKTTELLFYYFSQIRQLQTIDSIGSSLYSHLIETVLFWYKKNQEHIALLPTDTMGSWSVLTITPTDDHPSAYNEILTALHTDHPSIQRLRNSNIDGWWHQWVIIEQQLDKGIKSSFIGKELRILSHFDGTNTTGDYFDLIQDTTNQFLLDTTEGKIFANGVRVSSKQLHSQSSTIDILSILLKKPGESIHNKELPLSSYTKDRNQFSGKIVGPMKQLIKQTTWDTIQREISWKLYDFHTRFDPDNVRFGLLSKLL